MKKLWPLLALGIGAFLLFALFTLPATVVLPFFETPNVTLGGVSGTLWSGRAQAVRSGSLHIGSVEWKLDVLRLFTGKLGADVRITRTDGFAQGSIAAAPGGRVTLRNFNASLPVGALPPNVVRGGWTGTLTLKLGELTLENSWPVAATGTVEIADLVGPADRPAALGNYRIVFPAEGGAANALTGALTDTGGPLAVNGIVQLNNNRSFLVNGLIAARPGAPDGMSRTLELLGEPDAQGRRQFGFEDSM